MHSKWYKFTDKKPQNNRIVLVFSLSSDEPDIVCAKWYGEKFGIGYDGYWVHNDEVFAWTYLPKLLENKARKKLEEVIAWKQDD